MWSWEQGRMLYFQFDALRNMAKFVVQNDMRNTSPATIRAQTGLPFLPVRYHPWRNHARIFKLALLAVDKAGAAVPTDVAKVLAQDGVATCDEYLHFLAQATMSPSPALGEWNHRARIRYPLCFALRYLLAKVSSGGDPIALINEVIGAYIDSDFVGDEDDSAFIGLVNSQQNYAQIVANLPHKETRQAKESIKFLCQISYLHCNRETIAVSLAADDACDIFDVVLPIGGQQDDNGNEEIERLASFFKGGSTHDFFDYQATTISNELDSGFVEGNKVRRSHIVIERNSGLRRRFFQAKPSAVCDACSLDTKQQYPWTDRVLDLHHTLPLSSGTRVDYGTGTLLDDLIAICPTCHRSIHRFYDKHLRKVSRSDFADKAEAVRVYEDAKNRIRAIQNAP